MKTNRETVVWIEEQIGSGDGCCAHFQWSMSHRPVEPGTLRVYLVPNNPLDRFIELADRRPVENFPVAVDACKNTVTVHFMSTTMPRAEPPPIGTTVWVRYGWRPPKYERAKIRVKLNGKKQWISLDELRDAVFRGRHDLD